MTIYLVWFILHGIVPIHSNPFTYKQFQPFQYSSYGGFPKQSKIIYNNNYMPLTNLNPYKVGQTYSQNISPNNKEKLRKSDNDRKPIVTNNKSTRVNISLFLPPKTHLKKSKEFYKNLHKLFSKYVKAEDTGNNPNGQIRNGDFQQSFPSEIYLKRNGDWAPSNDNSYACNGTLSLHYEHDIDPTFRENGINNRIRLKKRNRNEKNGPLSWNDYIEMSTINIDLVYDQTEPPISAFYKYEKDDDSIPPKIKTDPIMWISKLPQINQNLNKETSKIQLCESKSDCEKSYKVKCICSLFDMINKINTIIINSNNQKELLERISNLSCHNYIPITVEYKIPTAMNPRLIYTKRKELVVDAETGPKEISDSTIKQLLKRSIPNEGVDFYAFASSNIEIPCFSSDEMLLSINSPDSVQYLWAHGDNKLITEGRIIPDADRRGTLKIIGITMADSDNYTCTVNFKDPDTQLLTTLSFIHKVMVVSPPNIALHTSIHYGVSSKAKCDREVLEMFELYLSQQVEDIICKSRKLDKIHICEVEIYNPMCRRNDYEENDVNSKLLWTLGKKTNNSQKDQSYFSMLFQRNKRYSSYLPVEKLLEGDELMKNTAVLSLSYQVLMKDIWGFITAINNRSHCSPFCQQKITLILIKIIKRSILSGLSYPVNFSKATIYIPDLSSINTKVIIACEGGLHLSEGFCVPCPKGHFSEEGSTECKKCPWGTYQDKIASIKCEACSHPLKEGCYEMMFVFSFYTILVSASIFLILFTCCYYFCCCRTSKTKMTEYTPVKLICEECPRVRNKKVLRENRSKKNLLSSEIEKDGCKNSFRVKGFNHFPQQRRL